jgi:hypothetical protein
LLVTALRLAPNDGYSGQLSGYLLPKPVVQERLEAASTLTQPEAAASAKLLASYRVSKSAAIIKAHVLTAHVRY